MEIQGNHEQKEKHVVENQYHMGSMISQLESTNIESHNHNHDFSLQEHHHHGFKLAPRNCYITKINMSKFDGNDPITWIFRMEQYFDLHQVTYLQKLNIIILHPCF